MRVSLESGLYSTLPKRPVVIGYISLLRPIYCCGEMAVPDKTFHTPNLQREMHIDAQHATTANISETQPDLQCIRLSPDIQYEWQRLLGAWACLLVRSAVKIQFKSAVRVERRNGCQREAGKKAPKNHYKKVIQGILKATRSHQYTSLIEINARKISREEYLHRVSRRKIGRQEPFWRSCIRTKAFCSFGRRSDC